MTTNNAEWRNFCINVDDNKFISLGQNYHEETGKWESTEVALFVNGNMVGDPVRFKYFRYLSDIVEAAIQGDYKVFERHYLVELDLFEAANDD